MICAWHIWPLAARLVSLDGIKDLFAKKYPHLPSFMKNLNK